jgi:hypothetical protein
MCGMLCSPENPEQIGYDRFLLRRLTRVDIYMHNTQVWLKLMLNDAVLRFCFDKNLETT